MLCFDTINMEEECVICYETGPVFPLLCCNQLLCIHCKRNWPVSCPFCRAEVSEYYRFDSEEVRQYRHCHNLKLLFILYCCYCFIAVCIGEILGFVLWIQLSSDTVLCFVGLPVFFVFWITMGYCVSIICNANKFCS